MPLQRTLVRKDITVKEEIQFYPFPTGISAKSYNRDRGERVSCLSKGISAERHISERGHTVSCLSKRHQCRSKLLWTSPEFVIGLPITLSTYLFLPDYTFDTITNTLSISIILPITFSIHLPIILSLCFILTITLSIHLKITLSIFLILAVQVMSMKSCQTHDIFFSVSIKNKMNANI